MARRRNRPQFCRRVAMGPPSRKNGGSRYSLSTPARTTFRWKPSPARSCRCAPTETGLDRKAQPIRLGLRNLVTLVSRLASSLENLPGNTRAFQATREVSVTGLLLTLIRAKADSVNSRQGENFVVGRFRVFGLAIPPPLLKVLFERFNVGLESNEVLMSLPGADYVWLDLVQESGQEFSSSNALSQVRSSRLFFPLPKQINKTESVAKKCEWLGLRRRVTAMSGGGLPACCRCAVHAKPGGSSRLWYRNSISPCTKRRAYEVVAVWCNARLLQVVCAL